MLTTREPNPEPAPLFKLVRGAEGCAWAVRADVPEDVAAEIDRIVQTEPPNADGHALPVHAPRYASVLAAIGLELRSSHGPAFAFPEVLPMSCARSSDVAAEAGLETASAFRDRGFAARVTAASAKVIRDSGRIPLYSTDWTNAASIGVARKLGLRAYASGWGLSA